MVDTFSGPTFDTFSVDLTQLAVLTIYLDTFSGVDTFSGIDTFSGATVGRNIVFPINQR